jgi:hypothetical protein
VDFDRHVAPLLARRCLECHHGEEPKGSLDLSSSEAALRGGDSGPALVPGNPAESLLWQRIEKGEMPPKKRLTAEEKATLQSWLASGAKWGDAAIDPFRYTTESRAGYDWWALQPLVRPKPPNVQNAAWLQNPIDAFVLARLEACGLTPSPPADARTLYRRMSFDLLGLPPSPEELESLTSGAESADRAKPGLQLTSPSRLARSSTTGHTSEWIDRLLASPHYGERWARHWLDVARFGESQGFERDKLRTNAWRYRDWVVNAFNQDLPYDQFARLQLAGDVLEPKTPQGLIATGFLVAGPYDEVGQQQQSDAMKAIVRQDELEDIASAVGQTFLGLTVNCARCHDHKFDPIAQREYYRMTAALGGVRHGERELPAEFAEEAARSRLAAVQVRIGLLTQRVAEIEAPARRDLLAAREVRSNEPPPEPIAAWEFNGDLSDRYGSLHATSHGGATLSDGELRLDGKETYAVSTPLTRPVKSKTLEAWVRLDNLKQRGGGVVGVQSLDGQVFDAIVFGEREPGRWIAGSDHFKRTQDFGGPQETVAKDELVHIAVAWHADGAVAAYRNGQPYGKSYKSNGPVEFKSGEAQVVFGLRHAPPGGNKHLAGGIEKARLYDRALSDDEIARSAGVTSKAISEAELAARLDDAQKSLRDQWLFELTQLRAQENRLKDRKIYAVAPKEPPPMHLLKRGNPGQPGEVVAAGGIASVAGLDADFGLAPDAPESQRRLQLAEWIASPKNPLFARVIVNRLWHYHFGTGIVDTPNDFGFNGGRPSHPELLDWLACELVDHSYSLKHVHRLILQSATYQQASRASAAAMQVDAGNRLLWRQSPRRLEAEAVRDSMLHVAGELDLGPQSLGGPGFEEFTTYVRNSQFYNLLDPVGQAFNRRSLYRTWVRSARNRFLDVFDCPDPSAKAPARSVTVTPLQTLSLLNHSLVLRLSDRFAQRVRREAGDDPARQIERAFLLALQRPPEDEELRLTTSFVREHGLPALARVLFNSNEFLYVD